MASSTKPEVHSISQPLEEIEPRQKSTCTENLVKFGRVVFEICERTDRQTDKLTCSSQYFVMKGLETLHYLLSPDVSSFKRKRYLKSQKFPVARY